ncbi:hypothetical protein LXL04_006252 [Taraxacum kok-saghyz]
MKPRKGTIVNHAMYAYFDRDNAALKGLAKFFKESSEEEREHAEMFMEYQITNNKLYKEGDLSRVNGAKRSSEFWQDHNGIKVQVRSREAPVHDVGEETFPNLLNIFSRLVQIGNPSKEVADLINLICKIYWYSICPEISKKLVDPNRLEIPVPLEGQPTDPHLPKSLGWWKVKKWAVHILNRLYT